MSDNEISEAEESRLLAIKAEIKMFHNWSDIGSKRNSGATGARQHPYALPVYPLHW